MKNWWGTFWVNHETKCKRFGGTLIFSSPLVQHHHKFKEGWNDLVLPLLAMPCALRLPDKTTWLARKLCLCCGNHRHICHCFLHRSIKSKTFFCSACAPNTPNMIFEVRIWARQIWSSAVSLKRSYKMQFRCDGLVSIGTPSRKLWPNLIFGPFPHCNYNVD